LLWKSIDMTTGVMARETIFSLRRQIARIEGTLPERFAAPAGAPSTASGTGDRILVRQGGSARSEALLATGVESLDDTLGGGLLKAALTEIHGPETRDTGAVSGFAMALLGRLGDCQQAAGPALWIGTAQAWQEGGFPYSRGLQTLFGMAPHSLLFCEVPKLADALWVAEEAARLTALSAVVLEIRGNPQRLDLTASRRLHARAQQAAKPVLLLRQAALAEPTAAPIRLVVEPAASAPRSTLDGPLDGSIGRPAFAVSVSKSRTGRWGKFILEWNFDERSFNERHGNERHGNENHDPIGRRHGERAENPVAVVSLPCRGANMATASGTRLAVSATGLAPAAGAQPSPAERTTHRRTRRAG
jgi:protein ImuA